MKNLSINLQVLISLLALTLLLALVFTGCQVEEPEPPAVSFEDLSPIKQTYFQQGLIELVPDDLPAPVIPDEPGQLERGQLKYYQVCLACHGNWGQGLTDEWRETGFGEDMNCWQSKCHAPNHPPQGFEIPREMPPLLGITALSTISNAQQLYQIIYQTMPWWDPGSLTSDEAVDLTAYLLDARGELPDGIELTQDNLEAFPLHGQPTELVDTTRGGIVLIFGLSVAMASYIWSKKSPNQGEQ